MNRSDKHIQSLIYLVLCLVIVKGLLYGLLIPFDRAPDESHHFKLIKAKQLQLNHASEEDERRAAAEFGHIRYYLLHLEANPRKYAVEDFLDEKLPKPPSSFQLYYTVMAWMLKLCSFERVLDEIYLLRGISILCGLIVVWISACVVRELFPDNPFLLVGVPVFITFIPQFSAMNGVISDDKLVEVFLSLFFWLLVILFKNGIRWQYVVGCLLTMGLAILSKRTAMFLVPFVLVVIFVYWWKFSLGVRMHLVLLVLLTGLAIGGYHLARYADEMARFKLTRQSFDKLRDEHIPDHILERLRAIENQEFLGRHTFFNAVEKQIGTQQTVTYKKLILKHVDEMGVLISKYVIWIPPAKMKEFFVQSYSPAMLTYYAKFFTVMYWSFWAVFGYMTIHVHHFWYLLIAFFQAIAAFGVLRFAFLARFKRRVIPQWKSKILYLFVVSIFFLLGVILLRSIVFRPGDPFLAQGRRLFAVIIPVSLVTMLGIEELIPRKYHKLAGFLGFIGLLVFDTVCLLHYILLNFHDSTFF